MRGNPFAVDNQCYVAIYTGICIMANCIEWPSPYIKTT